MKANVKKTDERLVPVTIAGRVGYFNFSLAAAKEIMPHMAEIDKISESNDDASVVGAIDVIAEAFSVALREGARYTRLMAELTGESNDTLPIAPTAEDLCTLLKIPEIMELLPQFTEALKIGAGRDVEVKPDPKNAKTAQGA